MSPYKKDYSILGSMLGPPYSEASLEGGRVFLRKGDSKSKSGCLASVLAVFHCHSFVDFESYLPLRGVQAQDPTHWQSRKRVGIG